MEVLPLANGMTRPKVETRVTFSSATSYLTSWVRSTSLSPASLAVMTSWLASSRPLRATLAGLTSRDCTSAGLGSTASGRRGGAFLGPGGGRGAVEGGEDGRRKK